MQVARFSVYSTKIAHIGLRGGTAEAGTEEGPGSGQTLLETFQIFENVPFSKQFRSKIASYHYAGMVDAQMFSYLFEMFKNCLES